MKFDGFKVFGDFESQLRHSDAVDVADDGDDDALGNRLSVDGRHFQSFRVLVADQMIRFGSCKLNFFFF